MISDVVVSHYTHALLQLAPSTASLETHALQLKELTALFQTNSSLQQTLLSPSILNEQKKKVLQDVLRDKIDKELLHFLFLLIDKRRWNAFLKISQAYQECAQQKLGKMIVQLATAVPVEPQIKEKLQSKLKQIYHKQIDIQENIDPTLLGGMVLIINDQIIDRSIKHRLKQLKENLLAVNIE